MPRSYKQQFASSLADINRRTKEAEEQRAQEMAAIQVTMATMQANMAYLAGLQQGGHYSPSSGISAGGSSEGEEYSGGEARPPLALRHQHQQQEDPGPPFTNCTNIPDKLKLSSRVLNGYVFSLSGRRLFYGSGVGFLSFSLVIILIRFVVKFPFHSQKISQ
jgi:hypothetical protein